MKHLTSKSEQKFQRVMHEFGQGELKSHGEKVTDQKQALAIAFSEARKIYPNYGMMKKAGEVNPTAVKGIFSLDAIEGKNFPGYTFGDDWNGWATPYFERPEANLIMEALGGTYKDGKYLFDDGYDGLDEFEKQTIDTVDGPKEVYAIGAYNWTWNNDLLKNGGSITSDQAAAIAKIYKTGTAKQLWEAWTPDNRIHFLMDHATEYFELMGDDFYKSSQGFSILTYDTLPSPIRKSVIIHHAQGMYGNGGDIDPMPGEMETPEQFKKWAEKRNIELINEFGGFKIGDIVEFTNEYGVSFAPLNIIGISKDERFNNRRFYLNKDSYWFPLKIEEIKMYKSKMADGGGVGKESYPGENFREAMKPIIQKIIKSKVGNNKNEFMRNIGYQAASKSKTKLSVVLDNRYNYDIMIIFDYDRKGNLKKSRFIHQIKEWEYSLKDIEEIGGFEGQKQVLTELANEIGEALAANADKYADGGGVEGVDLFEDYENIPAKVQKILDKYEDAFMDGDYDGLAKAKAELKEIGYTFEYYLDGQAYDLRKIGQKGKVAETIRLQDKEWSKADGGKVQIISPPKSMSKEAVLAYNDVASGISEKEFYKKHPVGDYLQYKELVEKNPSIKYQMADGGSIKSPGGRGFFGLEKGQPVKSSADVQVGDIILSHSDQFNADNTIKITDKKTYGTNTHLSGIYWNPITNKRIGNEDLGIDPELNPNEYYWPKQKTKMNLSPSKQKLLSRINTLKAAKANAGAAAQKSIQKKIDVLQKQFDYNPSAKEKAMANKGKFALDVPASYSKWMYKKLWALKILPQIHKLNNTHSIVVSSKVNLDKAYEIYSDMLKEKKEKVPSLASISRKL